MKVYAVVTNCNTKVAVLLETLIVRILYQVKDTGVSRKRRQSRDGRSFDKDLRCRCQKHTSRLFSIELKDKITAICMVV